MRHLGELRELGVGLSLDDFGVGLSSLSALDRYPLDMLKIDRSFVGRLASGGERAERMFSAVLGAARAVGLKAVAEGIETRSQLETVKRLGCDAAQGFYLCRPEAAGHAEPAAAEPRSGRGGLMGAVAAAPARGRAPSRWRELERRGLGADRAADVAGLTGVAGVLTFVLREDLLALYPGRDAVRLQRRPGPVRAGRPGWRWTAGRASRVLGVFVALLGALTLVEHVDRRRPGHRPRPVRPLPRRPPSDRMAPNTAVCVTLAGLALCTRGRLSTVLAAVPPLIGLMAALGYTDPTPRRWPRSARA